MPYTASPGLHFKLPFGVDTATIVPIRRQLKLEFGFGTPGSTNPDQVGDQPDKERDMVTGDLNAANVEWIVQYNISRSQATTCSDSAIPVPPCADLTESVMCEVIGDRTVDEVLTIGRTEIEVESLKRLTAILRQLNMGLTVEQIQLKNVHPPGPVQRSFDEVNRSQQEREQMINEANGEYNRVIPKATRPRRTTNLRRRGLRRPAHQPGRGRRRRASSNCSPSTTRPRPSPNSVSIWKP